jgi:hypothetical protein
VAHDVSGDASTRMARAGDGLEERARKAGARLRWLRRGGGESDGRMKKTSEVNRDP